MQEKNEAKRTSAGTPPVEKNPPVNQNNETAESTVLSAPEEQGILIVVDREK